MSLSETRHDVDIDLESCIRSMDNIPSTPISASNLDGSGSNILYTTTSDAGVNVNQWTGLSCVPVYAAIKFIANKLSQVPCHIFQSIVTGGKRKAVEHPTNKILQEPNDAMNGPTFRFLLESHVQSWGNGYAYIERDAAFNIVSLKPLLPDRTYPYRLNTGELVYITRVNGDTVTLAPYEVLHLRGFTFNGLNGLSPIAQFRQKIGTALAYDKFGAKIFSNGLNANGLLTHPGNLTKNAQERLRQQITDKLTGLDNSHKILVLEEAMKFEKLTINPDDAQWIEAMKFSKEDIASIFGVPPHKIGALERSTNNNIEQQTLDALSDCLNPRYIDWEAELNRKLLRSDEKESYFFRFDLKELLRGDMTATGNFYKALSGVLEVNEIREANDYNPLPYGNVIMVQMQNQPLEVLIESAKVQLEIAKNPPQPPPQLPPAIEPAADDAQSGEDATDAANEPPDASDGDETNQNSRNALDEQYRGVFGFAVESKPSADQLGKVFSPFVSAVRSMAAAECKANVPEDKNFHQWRDKYFAGMAHRLAKPSEDAIDDRAAYECRRLRSAVARETYAACGITQVRWAGGEFDKRVVSIADSFSTNSDRNIYHPPLSISCRSEIYPGEK